MFPPPSLSLLYYCSVLRHRERKKDETKIWAQTLDSEPPPHRGPRTNRLWESLLFRKVCNSGYVMPKWPIALQQMKPQAYPTHHFFRVCSVCYSQDNISVTIKPLNPLPWVVCYDGWARIPSLVPPLRRGARAPITVFFRWNTPSV